MAGKEAIVMHAWKEWGVQALVLLSFTLQDVLLVLAEFRRRVNSGTLKLFVWSAYMMADATAIHVLGHMSVISRSPEHQLVAFWAPFLLLHLGGQDNITAYAIEDNQLWLRHLQTLVVQAGAAAYVLSQSPLIAGGEQPLLRWATILMFVTYHKFNPSEVFDARVPKKLRRWGLYTFGLSRSVEDRILIWHIATNIYLTWWYQEHGKQPKEENNGNDNKKQPKATNKSNEAYKMEHSKQPSAEAAEALSNYMVFLLASRSDMMTGTGSRRAYVNMCFALVSRRPLCETAEELAGKLRSYGDKLLEGPETSDVQPDEFGFDAAGDEVTDDRYHVSFTLRIGCKLGAMLIRKHAADTPDVIAQAWLETLYYAAQSCSAYAHVKQLNNGGELITIAAILLEYTKRFAIRSL